MKYILWENLAVLLGAVFSAAYGIPRYLKPKKPLYATMIIFGMGCMALGRIYQCVRILTGSSVTGGFQVGVLGIMGAFSFFFSSNYGQIDSLVDDGSESFRRYRVSAWAGPALIAALYLPVAFGPQSVGDKAVCGVIACVIGASCYFHVKHLWIPDVDYGVVQCLRHFNALAWILGTLCMLEMVAMAYASDVLLLITGALMTAVCAMIIPVMDRGVRAWRT